MRKSIIVRNVYGEGLHLVQGFHHKGYVSDKEVHHSEVCLVRHSIMLRRVSDEGLHSGEVRL